MDEDYKLKVENFRGSFTGIPDTILIKAEEENTEG